MNEKQLRTTSFSLGSEYQGKYKCQESLLRSESLNALEEPRAGPQNSETRRLEAQLVTNNPLPLNGLHILF